MLERVMPGRELVDLVHQGRDDEAMGIICDVAASLHSATATHATLSRFPSVVEWGHALARSDVASASSLPAALIRRARSLLDELNRSSAEKTLLHGDLHHFNVLHDDERGWLAIDPKGVLGDRAYEFGAALRNPAGSDVDVALSAPKAVVDRRSRIISERLGIERERLLSWCVVHCALSAVWSWEDDESPSHAIAVAESALSLLRIR